MNVSHPKVKWTNPTILNIPMVPTQTVESLLDSLDHPLRSDVDTVRQMILDASPTIKDGIHWNSLSFRTTEWFATFNWKLKDQVQIILHLGAKVKDAAEVADIPDPDDRLKWQAKDRAALTLHPSEIERCRETVTTLIQEWIKHV